MILLCAFQRFPVFHEEPSVTVVNHTTNYYDKLDHIPAGTLLLKQLNG